MLEGLNERQLEAVTTTEGPVMVMAGAGSGKTRVLTERIAHIIDMGISPFQILAVTFTNKAANEMKRRVEELVHVETKYMWISTFHSFCARLLRLEITALPPYSKNFLILDEEDSLKIIKDICKANNIEEMKPKKLQSLISKVKNFPNYYFKDPYLKSVFEKVNTKYNQYLEENNMLDFDDLIIKTIELFKKNPVLLEKYQEKFQYILVDEFQDTNDLQYNLIFMLAARYHNVFVVGDDFQSIYSFRGARIENINRFRNDFKEHQLILLEENYRSTSPILNLANEIIKHNPNQIKKVMFTEKKEGVLPFYYEAASGKSEAMFVVDKIKEFHLAGDSYSDFAILYRTNHISRVFEDLLIKYQIPYKIYGGLSFFARKEIKDMVAYLRVIVYPEDDFSFMRIVNEPKRKIGSALLEKLHTHALEEKCSLFNSIPTFKGTGAGYNALMEFHKIILSIKEQINNIPLVKLIDIILEETGYKAMLALDDPEHERLENVYELKTVLRETEDTVDGDNFDKLGKLLNDLSLRTDEDDKVERDSVILSTYHQVKGLEFKTVFMVAMEEGIFPSGFHSDDLDIEEERRICYVGITRAKERLYVTNAKARMLYGHMEIESSSRFVKEMGTEYLKNISADFYKKAKEKYDSYIVRKPKKAKTIIIDEEYYHVGDRIEHKAFGIGIVVSVGEDNFIKVAFPMPIGIKPLIKDHPSYKKVEKN
ncbi:MAG: UvrD-helicase domain-containing protein [Roseburia sp.]|nr:UvrD-helicase domain-containing protein [Anaeroplasma bactoclasticum]MCM1195575.1 UvrD-helicase domain-containing protein [Roseburia sp.]MCM1555990.1 UvrD-helicase domain-containing protein [Anaeroplasma bactoclasticum]